MYLAAFPAAIKNANPYRFPTTSFPSVEHDSTQRVEVGTDGLPMKEQKTRWRVPMRNPPRVLLSN